MLKRLYNSMIVARQASAASKTLPYLTDSHLEEMGLAVIHLLRVSKP